MLAGGAQRLELGVAGGIPRFQHTVDGARHQLIVSHQQGGEGAAPLLTVGQCQLKGLFQPPLMAGGRDGGEGVDGVCSGLGGL
ncbi:hypothetical protein D3C76_758040 [compost metagenome]